MLILVDKHAISMLLVHCYTISLPAERMVEGGVLCATAATLRGGECMQPACFAVLIVQDNTMSMTRRLSKPYLHHVHDYGQLS